MSRATKQKQIGGMPEASLQSCGVGPEGCEVWRNQRNQLTALWLRGAKADFWRAREGREEKKKKKTRASEKRIRRMGVSTVSHYDFGLKGRVAGADTSGLSTTFPLVSPLVKGV